MGKRTALVLVVFAALAACKKVDSAGLEKNVEAKLEAGGVKGAKVSCPKNVDAKKGVTFTCKITIGESSYDYDVEIAAVDGSKLDLTTSFHQGVPLLNEKVHDFLVTAVKEKIGVEPKIDCGKEALLFGEDDKLYCDITAGDTTGKLRVDVDGDVIKGWEIEAGK